MGKVQQIQITAAAVSADVSTYTDIAISGGEGPSGSYELGTQAVGFRIVSSATGAASTIVAVFTRTDGTTQGKGVQEIWTGEVTVTARRQGYANASGDYVCNVVWDKSSTNYIDTGGVDMDSATTVGDNLKLKLGRTVAGGLGTLSIECWATRNAG